MAIRQRKSKQILLICKVFQVGIPEVIIKAFTTLCFSNHKFGYILDMSQVSCSPDFWTIGNRIFTI
jgi:hypothetical protein